MYIINGMTAGLLLLVSVCWGQAGYIYAKAIFAQYLITDAWELSVMTSTPVKPWRWADTYPVAKLMIKQTDPLYVLAGASNRNLAFGPVLMNANVQSVERKQPFNIAIAGHRDTHFAVLEDINYGDPIILDIGTKQIGFIVDEIVIVDEKNLGIIDSDDGQVITLITCYPFDALSSATPLRYVVQGSVVPSLDG